jgi:hypothetical protein
MQGYSKVSSGRSIKVHYNGQVEASTQAYSKVSVKPSITIVYN